MHISDVAHVDDRSADGPIGRSRANIVGRSVQVHVYSNADFLSPPGDQVLKDKALTTSFAEMPRVQRSPVEVRLNLPDLATIVKDRGTGNRGQLRTDELLA
jgi:hypothetical protein